MATGQLNIKTKQHANQLIFLKNCEEEITELKFFEIDQKKIMVVQELLKSQFQFGKTFYKGVVAIILFFLNQNFQVNLQWKIKI